MALVISLIPNVAPGIGGGNASASVSGAPVTIRRSARVIEVVREGFGGSVVVSVLGISDFDSLTDFSVSDISRASITVDLISLVLKDFISKLKDYG